MVTSVQTSFIPKQATDTVRKRRSTGTWLLVWIALFLFLVSAGAAAGVYFYERMLTSDITEMRDRLERLRSSFEPSLIAELKRLDNRLVTLNSILEGHIQFSRFFSILEQETLQSVRFTQFSYTLDEKDGPLITLAGLARGYSSVALQSDMFGKSKYFHNPIFSDMTLDTSGNITFNVTLNVDSELVGYGAVVSGTPVSEPVTNTDDI